MPSKEEDLLNSGRSSTSSHPLLPDPEGYEFDSSNYPCKKRSKFTSILRPLFIHLLIFAAYAGALGIIYNNTRQQNCHPDMIFSPARKSVKYELVHAENDLMKKSPYAGYPSEEGDKAWRDLLRNSNIRISKEELDKLNRTSIQLQDASGDYFGGLSAHHHLHCIVSSLPLFDTINPTSA
ncbi:hypothetical protein B0J14DRAFT_477532 [Halenospora varia]|nr:hypothetical protein B0J14DRAFT_477532 [Halenospora varia]